MSQRDEQREREISERARELFADSVAGLDGRTRSRLAQARARAVGHGSRRRSAVAGGPVMLASVGTAVAAVIAAGIIWRSHDPAETRVTAGVEATVLGDWELLLEGEDLDLFEDLEFYAWLLEQPEMRVVTEEDGSG